MFETQWKMGGRSAAEAFSVREEVFIKEMGKARTEVFTEEDELAMHLMVLINDQPIASARFAPYQGGVSMSQCCVLKEYRKQGFFDLMVRVMLDKAVQMGTERIYTHAPAALLPYFKAFGFACTSIKNGMTALSVAPQDILWHSPCRGRD